MAIDLNPYFAIHDRAIRLCYGDKLVSDIVYKYVHDPEAPESGWLTCEFTVNATVHEATKMHDALNRCLVALPGWFRLFVVNSSRFANEADDGG